MSDVKELPAASPAVKFMVTDLVTAVLLAAVATKLKVVEVVEVGVP